MIGDHRLSALHSDEPDSRKQHSRTFCLLHTVLLFWFKKLNCFCMKFSTKWGHVLPPKHPCLSAVPVSSDTTSTGIPLFLQVSCYHCFCSLLIQNDIPLTWRVGGNKRWVRWGCCCFPGFTSYLLLSHKMPF